MKVSACESCNSISKSADDSIFRDFIATCPDLYGTEWSVAMQPALARSIDQGHARLFRGAELHGTELTVDEDRVLSPFIRMSRGIAEASWPHRAPYLTPHGALFVSKSRLKSLNRIIKPLELPKGPLVAYGKRFAAHGRPLDVQGDYVMLISLAERLYVLILPMRHYERCPPLYDPSAAAPVAQDGTLAIPVDRTPAVARPSFRINPDWPS